MPSAFSGTELFASSTVKNSASTGRRMNSMLANCTAASRRPMSSVAKPMKETICATVASPCRCSSVPVSTMVMMATVEAPRVSTFTPAHQFSTGNWWRIT